MSEINKGKLADASGVTSHRNIVLAIILVSYLMGVLDVSIVITGLPKIQADFHASPTLLSWVQSAYTLAYGGFLLLGARAGDILGRRRVFLAGMAIFVVASVAIGLAQSLPFMLAARAVQGLGAALLTPSTLALLSTTFPEGEQRNRATSYYGAVAGIGSSGGLVLGGFLAETLSWRVGFFINLPIGVAMMLLARRYVPETQGRPDRFDLAGAFSSTLGMTALVFGIVRSPSTGWGDPVTLGTVVGAVLLLAFFVVNERRAAQPILPLRLFASPQRVSGYAGRGLFLGAMNGFWFFMSQFFQSGLGYSPLVAGAAFLPTTVVSVAVAMNVPRLSTRYGNARIAVGGLTISVLGLAWLSRLSAGTPYLTGLMPPMVLIGIGQGSVLGPFTGLAMTGVRPEEAGAGSGLVNATQQLGGSLGLSVLVAVFAASGATALDPRQQLAHRVGASITGSAALLVIALTIVAVLSLRKAKISDAAPSAEEDSMKDGYVPTRTALLSRPPQEKTL